MSITQLSETVAASVCSTDNNRVTVASSGIGDGIVSGISHWRGGSPGHSDTSGSTLDCCHISGRWGNYTTTLIMHFETTIVIPATVRLAEPADGLLLATVHL